MESIFYSASGPLTVFRALTPIPQEISSQFTSEECRMFTNKYSLSDLSFKHSASCSAYVRVPEEAPRSSFIREHITNCHPIETRIWQLFSTWTTTYDTDIMIDSMALLIETFIHLYHRCSDNVFTKAYAYCVIIPYMSLIYDQWHFGTDYLSSLALAHHNMYTRNELLFVSIYTRQLSFIFNIINEFLNSGHITLLLEIFDEERARHICESLDRIQLNYNRFYNLAEIQDEDQDDMDEAEQRYFDELRDRDIQENIQIRLLEDQPDDEIFYTRPEATKPYPVLSECCICFTENVSDYIITKCCHVACKTCAVRSIRVNGECWYCRSTFSSRDDAHLYHGTLDNPTLGPVVSPDYF